MMKSTPDKSSSGPILFHLPKILVILGGLGYEIYLFIMYGPYFLKYANLPVVLLVGTGLVGIVIFSLNQTGKRYGGFRSLRETPDAKQTRFLFLYYAIMALGIFLPTILLTFAVSLLSILISFPALCLLIIEIFFLSILGHPKVLNKWETRFVKRKVVWSGVLIATLLSPMLIQVSGIQVQTGTDRTEVTFVSQFDSVVFDVFPQELQQQYLDTVWTFDLNCSRVNGSLTDYVTNEMNEKGLTTRSHPGFIEAKIHHLSSMSRITVVQVNITLNSTVDEYGSIRFDNAEEPSVSWEIYLESGAFWVNPGIIFSATENSSLNLEAPFFYCEVEIEYNKGGWVSVCDITETAIIDSGGEILVITRDVFCWAYA